MKHCAWVLVMAGAALHGAEAPCSAQEPKARAILNAQVPKERADRVVFSPDGKTLVSGSWDGTVRLWNVASAKETASLKDKDRSGDGVLWSIAITSDGKTLASGYEHGTIALWDVATGKPRSAFKGGQEAIRSLVFSTDGKTLVSGDEEGTVKVWDLATGKERAALKASARSLRVVKVLFSPDDKTLAVSSGPAPGDEDLRDEVRLWHAATLKELCTIKTDQPNVSIAFAPDGKTLATGNRPGNIKLWSVTTGKEVVSLTDHPGCQALAFSGDGKTLRSASMFGTMSGTTKAWDVATGKERSTIKTHAKVRLTGTHSFAFSPDNKLLAVVNRERGVIELWDIPETPR